MTVFVCITLMDSGVKVFMRLKDAEKYKKKYDGAIYILERKITGWEEN